MKKFLSIIGIIGGFSIVANAATISTNILGPGTFLLSTNRASVYQIELTGATSCAVNLYDCDNLAAPFYGTNYTAGAYNSRITYPTNYVTTFVGSNGFTNYYTNAGVWSLTITNAAVTNTLPIIGSFVVAGGTYAVYNTDMLFSRGISVNVNTNVSI